MNNHDKKRNDKKLTDITTGDVERFAVKVVIGTAVGLALLMLVIYLICLV